MWLLYFISVFSADYLPIVFVLMFGVWSRLFGSIAGCDLASYRISLSIGNNEGNAPPSWDTRPLMFIWDIIPEVFIILSLFHGRQILSPRDLFLHNLLLSVVTKVLQHAAPHDTCLTCLVCCVRHPPIDEGSRNSSWHFLYNSCILFTLKYISASWCN